MKIGISSSSFIEKDLQKSLEFTESLKVKYFEILNEYPNTENETDILNSYDLKYTVHSPITDLNLASLNKTIRKASIDEVKLSIDLASGLNSDIVVIHPSGLTLSGKPCEEKILAKCKNSLKICGDYGKNNDVITTVENMSNMKGFLYQNIYKLNKLLLDLKMNMTMDIGHACTLGFKEKELYFESIKHIHLSNNFRDYDSHLGLEQGDINFKKIFTLFKKKGYDGIYMIEVNNEKSIINSLNFLKKSK